MSEIKSAVALGNFDGVHLGHISVLQKALFLKNEYGFQPIALLFKSHPAEFFGKKLTLLTTYQKRNELIEKLGIKVVEIDFESIKDMSPKEFVEEILVKRLNAGAVCCGFNYHFGKNSEGNSETLKQIANEKNIKVFVSEKVEIDSELISSSRIRKAISNGDITLANKMLGREFSFENEVVFGESRGKMLGFPTANQDFRKNIIIPKTGVYASSCDIDEVTYFGFTDIGKRPTFDNGDVRAETHLFDFEKDLYGRNIEIKLYKYLRNEKKFSSEKELINQLNIDKRAVIEYLKKETDVFSAD